MSTEILQNKKIKYIMLTLTLIIICLVAYFGIQEKSSSNSYLNKQLASKEFDLISGDWKIVSYLGEGVEYNGAEVKTESQKTMEDKIVTEIKEKYLNKELCINKKNVTTFGAPTELGYYSFEWDDLFEIYRQPPSGLGGISPPFLCASFELKGYNDELNIIIDNNAIAILSVKGQFFNLIRIG